MADERSLAAAAPSSVVKASLFTWGTHGGAEHSLGENGGSGGDAVAGTNENLDDKRVDGRGIDDGIWSGSARGKRRSEAASLEDDTAAFADRAWCAVGARNMRTSLSSVSLICGRLGRRSGSGDIVNFRNEQT